MYNVLVVFNDGSKKIFNDVLDWGFSTDCCYIKKIDPVKKGENTVISLMFGENVKYIGPAEFWNEDEETKLICCKDCEYYIVDPFDFCPPYCSHFCTNLVGGINVKPDDFCSRAVRRKK